VGPSLLIRCNAAAGYIVRRGGRNREDSSRKRANGGNDHRHGQSNTGKRRGSTGMARPRAAALSAGRDLGDVLLAFSRTLEQPGQMAPGEFRAVFLRQAFLDRDPDIGEGNGRDQFGAGNEAPHENAS
jgi:hypothetical protein